MNEAPWRRRFRATRLSLPMWAHDEPDRCLYRSNGSGVTELHAWDRRTGTHRQVTSRRFGTTSGELDPTGNLIWWFDDEHGNELGHWMVEPFSGGAPAVVVSHAVPKGYQAGLALGAVRSVVGISTESGSTVFLLDGPGADAVATELYRHRQDAHVGPLDRAERLVVIAHSEHGDARNRALRVVDVAVAPGAIVGELWDGPGRGLAPVAWSPVPGDERLLVVHDRSDQPRPLLWHPPTGAVVEIDVDLPGEVWVSWFPDATALLVTHDHLGRSELFRLPLDGQRVVTPADSAPADSVPPAGRLLEPIATPPGSVTAAAVRPDGELWYQWSDAANPWQIRAMAPIGGVGGIGGIASSLGGIPDRVLIESEGQAAPAGVPCRSIMVEGPAGPIQSFVFEPLTTTADAGPRPTIFDIHGGPEAHDVDAFHPRAQAWVDHGWAVVLVNYRGSDGYGKAWRDAIVGNPGLTELEDVVAVRDHLVAIGLADPDRFVLSGRSWGGYLTLLGLGTRPAAWSLGVAVVPVADYIAAFEDEMEPLKAYDRALFGGSPREVPHAYRERSPITFVDDVAVPVLVLAGENDPRCPIRQIDNYLEALRDKGKAYEVYRYDAGHGSLVVDESIRQVEVVLDFLHRHHGSPRTL